MNANMTGDVDHQLSRFIRRSRTRGLRLAAEIDTRLDYSGYLLLHAIIEADTGIRGSALAESFGVHKSTISRAIAHLEKLGLTTRVPDPRDGRAQLLTATDEARSKIATIQSRGHTMLTTILSDWKPEEREAFARNLACLNDAAERYTGE